MNISATGNLAPLMTQKSSTPSMGLNADTFLKIFTTQIANQNPMEPMNSADFLNQFAQITNVQSMAEMQKTMGDFRNSMALLQNNGLISQMENLLGRNVGYIDSNGVLQNGNVEAIRIGTDGVPQLVIAGTLVGAGAVRQVSLPPAA